MGLSVMRANSGFNVYEHVTPLSRVIVKMHRFFCKNVFQERGSDEKKKRMGQGQVSVHVYHSPVVQVLGMGHAEKSSRARAPNLRRLEATISKEL
jgi:hypothetical protein